MDSDNSKSIATIIDSINNLYGLDIKLRTNLNKTYIKIKTDPVGSETIDYGKIYIDQIENDDGTVSYRFDFGFDSDKSVSELKLQKLQKLRTELLIGQKIMIDYLIYSGLADPADTNADADTDTNADTNADTEINNGSFDKLLNDKWCTVTEGMI